MIDAGGSRGGVATLPRVGPQGPTDPPVIAQVPTNLPNPKYHPVVLVEGLHAWFDTLDLEYRRSFLRYLFGIDPDAQSPAPGLFLQPISNYRLAACYDMCTVVARELFVRLVRWKGVADELPHPGALDEEDGYCYAAAVVPAARDKMRAILGRNPWAPAVAAYLLAEPGVWTPDRLTLTTGLRPLDEVGPVYTQGHLDQSPIGVRVRALIPLLCGWVRLGAATGDRLALLSEGTVAHTVSKPTLFDEPPAGARMSITLGFYASFKNDQPIVWSPFATPALVLMLGMYESVRIEAANFSLTVPSGAVNAVYCGITRTGVPVKATEWYAMPYLKIINGSDQGSVVGDYYLPPRHAFNPELRAATPGNGPPEFKFGLGGAAGAEALLVGNVRVSVAGQVVMHSVDIGPKGKALTSVRAVQRSLPYVVQGHSVEPPAAPGQSVAHDDDSDDESEDEDDGPRATSQSGSPSRTK